MLNAQSTVDAARMRRAAVMDGIAGVTSYAGQVSKQLAEVINYCSIL